MLLRLVHFLKSIMVLTWLRLDRAGRHRGRLQHRTILRGVASAVAWATVDWLGHVVEAAMVHVEQA